MDRFFQIWGEAAYTTLGLFWMAFWAFGFGYLISSMIQVFITNNTIKKKIGKSGPISILVATFFGFISSSCSFAALATTRSLFSKGAGLIPSLAFMLASTNLVIELGIVIAVFLSWQFVVGEYVGGILLILLMWLFVKLTLSNSLEKQARENAKKQSVESKQKEKSFRKKLFSYQAWCEVACSYVMEWKMVWKDVTIGFTVAGIISAAVPKAYFHALFWGAGNVSPGFLQVLVQTLTGPVAAFFTFIGSMGNIPLASVLYSNGVCFSAIMAFIFSDLIVFPALRIQARYYGWRMALYLQSILLAIIVASALVLHYAFAIFDSLPVPLEAAHSASRAYFEFNSTLFLNLFFITLSLVFLWWRSFSAEKKTFTFPKSVSECILFGLAVLSLFWLLIGLVIYL